MWLFVIIIGLPLIEIALFIIVGGWLSLWPTLALVLGTALLGSSLLTRGGVRTLMNMRSDRARGGDSHKGDSQNIGSGFLNIICGVLLIIPGFLTDSLALVLLIPAMRRAVLGRFDLRMATQWQRGSRKGQPGAAHQTSRPYVPGQNDVIDAEFYEVDANDAPKKRS